MGVLTDVAANVTYQEVTFAASNAGPQELAKADSQRYSITFAYNVASAVISFLSTNPAQLTVQGFPITGTGIITFKVADHGAAAQAAWYLYSGTAGWPITVLTVRVPKE